MAGRSEVRWSRDGQRFVHAADDATAFVRELFRQYGESVEDLEVRRARQTLTTPHDLIVLPITDRRLPRRDDGPGTRRCRGRTSL